MKKRKASPIRFKRKLLPVNLHSLPASLRMNPFNSAEFIIRLIYISQTLAVLTMLIGAISLIGWATHNELLKSIFPRLPTMKVNSAIVLILGGISLLLSHWHGKNIFFIGIKNLLALGIVLIGIITLGEYLFRLPFSIDQLFFKESSGTVGTPFPNRMTLNSALIALFIGLSLFFLDIKLFGRWITQTLIFMAVIILIPTLIGYIYGIDFIYGIATSTKIALATAIGYFLLIIGTFFARPRHGFMTVMTYDSAGGFLARQLLSTSIIIPLILGWVVLNGYHLGLYDADFRYLLLIASCILVFTILIWRNAQLLHIIDTRRGQSEQQILFLAQASKVLSSSLNYKTTLKNIAELAVPVLADFFYIDLIGQQRKLQRVAWMHKDSKKRRMFDAITKYVPSLHSEYPISKAIMTGKPLFVPHVTNTWIHQSAMSPEHEKFMQQFQYASLITVPIIAGKNSIGALTCGLLVSSYRSYTFSDLAAAEELASRIALALENARLYRNSERAINLRDEFISAASHELKTPITSLKVFLQVMQKQFEREHHEENPQLGKMRLQVDKLTTLINDLLDVSRIQLGKLAFHTEQFDLSALVQEIIDILQPTTKEHRIRFEKTTLIKISGDRDRIGQVIMNLITNAMKYSPVDDDVIVTLSRDKKFVTLSVQDFGIGIDKKHQKKIFNRFYQIKDSRHPVSPGIGMGLYISREIIKRHGGRIWVESTHGKGSIFRFTLPYKN